MEKSVHTPAYGRLLRQLRSVRTAAGLSQRDLAARLDVPPSWVAKVEIGERRVDVIEFARFVEACGSDAVTVLRHVLASTSPSAALPRRKP